MHALRFRPVTPATTNEEILEELALVARLGITPYLDYATLNLPNIAQAHGELGRLHRSLVAGKGELGGYMRGRVLEMIASWRRTPRQQVDHDAVKATALAAVGVGSAEARRFARLVEENY